MVYSGHWDHHGTDGTQIFHGASDNAAGTAGVLELARAFKTLTPAPKRTIVFFWPTAEEKGLLGARWYVDHPFLPLAATVANINLDYFSNWGFGRTRDFSIVGLGNSTLDDLTAEAVARQGRTLTGDTAPEQGFYFRSDHYEFARVGVPSLETSPGIDTSASLRATARQKRDEYIRNDYHKASDVPKADGISAGPSRTSPSCSKSATAPPSSPGTRRGSRMPSGVRRASEARSHGHRRDEPYAYATRAADHQRRRSLCGQLLAVEASHQRGAHRLGKSRPLVLPLCSGSRSCGRASCRRRRWARRRHASSAREL